MYNKLINKMTSRAMNKLGEEGNCYREETLARLRVKTFLIIIIPFLVFGWLAADTDVLTILFYPYVIVFIATLILLIFSLGGFKKFARKHMRISAKVVFLPQVNDFVQSISSEEQDYTSFSEDFKKSFDIDTGKYDLSDSSIIDQATHLEIAKFISTRFALNDNLYDEKTGLTEKGFLYEDLYKQSLSYSVNNEFISPEQYEEQLDKFEKYIEKITKKAV